MRRSGLLSPEDLAAWHEWEVKAAEQDRNWFAIIYHLGRVPAISHNPEMHIRRGIAHLSRGHWVRAAADLVLHNDQDEAVPWQQGIEYYLALRRLGKEVYLFNYPGEKHGLTQRVNQKDYTVRMREFFAHYLMGKPAPKWLKEGVPHLKLDDHLKERGKQG